MVSLNTGLAPGERESWSEWGLHIARTYLKLRLTEPGYMGSGLLLGLQQSKVHKTAFLAHVETITTLHCLGFGGG